MYSTDCECVQGIEYFIDPRPYMPSYESPDDGFFHTGYPWIDKALLDTDKQNNTNSETSTDTNNKTNSSSNIDVDRVVNLFVCGNTLINTGYIHLVAYQVKSCYISLSSTDSNWINGRLSLILQHVESGVSRTVPVTIDKKIVIPAEVLFPGTLRVAVTCLEKTDDYATMLSDSLDITVHDPGIKEVDWGTRPDYDVYYHFQTNVRNLTKSQEDINSNVANCRIKCLELEKEVGELQTTISKLTKTVEALEKRINLV